MVFNKLDDDLLQKTNGLKHESFLNLQMVQNQSAFMLYKTIVSKQSFFSFCHWSNFLAAKAAVIYERFLALQELSNMLFH